MSAPTRRQAVGGDPGENNSGTGGGGDESSSVRRRRQQRTPQALRHLEETMTDLRDRYARLGYKGGCVLLLSVILSFAFYWHLAHYVFLTHHSRDPYFLKMETCPACYGVDFCHRFGNSEVTFTGVYQYPISHRLTPNRRVFEGRRGHFQGHPVIIKSLAGPDQLSGLQGTLCEFSNLRDSRQCNMRDALWKRLPLGEDTLTLYDLEGVGDMFRCPSQRLLDDVKEAFRLRDPERPKRLLRNEEMSLLFTAMANQEPLMLMTFTSEKGWPFPQYYGACGRFVVVEHRGQPATELLTAPLPDRLLVSQRILELALRLTGSDTGFALYLNDWDLANFAVYPTTRTVTLVDLSNVTVVDARQLAASADHHVTREIGSPADGRAVCRHRLSDWNLLAACGMLRETLLRDLGGGGGGGAASDIAAELDKCASAEPQASRFQLAKSIISGLDKLH